MPRFRVRLHAPALPLLLDGKRGQYGAYLTRFVAAPDAAAAEAQARSDAAQLLATRVPPDVVAEDLPLVTEAVERLSLLAGRFARQPGIIFYPTAEAGSDAAAI